MDKYKTLEYRDGTAYFEGEALENITAFSIAYDTMPVVINQLHKEYINSTVAHLRVTGLATDSNGEFIVQFGDFVEYNIAEYVEVIRHVQGGKS